MTDFLILDGPQANIVRGKTEPGNALDPRETADGKWALPLAVLTDRHAPHLNRLRALPRGPVTWPEPDLDEDLPRSG